jgi:hypothetical protein
VDLASFHPSGAYSFEVRPEFLENLCTRAVNGGKCLDFRRIEEVDSLWSYVMVKSVSHRVYIRLMLVLIKLSTIEWVCSSDWGEILCGRHLWEFSYQAPETIWG